VECPVITLRTTCLNSLSFTERLPVYCTTLTHSLPSLKSIDSFKFTLTAGNAGTRALPWSRSSGLSLELRLRRIRRRQMPFFTFTYVRFSFLSLWLVSSYTTEGRAGSFSSVQKLLLLGPKYPLWPAFSWPLTLCTPLLCLVVKLFSVKSRNCRKIVQDLGEL
jgi:hypothetical protein